MIDRVLQEHLSGWPLGCITAPQADSLPDSAFPRGRNTVLASVAPGMAVPAQRRGWRTVNDTAVDGHPACTGQAQYRRQLGVTTAQAFHIQSWSTGALTKRNADDTLSPADLGSPIPLAPAFYPPSFAQLGNLLFVANGSDRLAYDGTDVFPIGMDSPAAPAVTLGTAGNFEPGTYDFSLTYYNATTGYETSRSAQGSVTVPAGSPTGSFTLTWMANTSGHPYTHTRVYIRYQTTQTDFFLLQALATPTTTLALTAKPVYVNLITLAPTRTANDRPPAGILGVVAHAGRLFAHDASRIYYSSLTNAEAFDARNAFPLNENDGKPITAMHSAHEVLLIFTRDSLWTLEGEDPQSWRLVPRSPDVGSLTHRSVVTIDGSTYWWSEQGPMRWQGSGAPESIGLLIAPTIASDAVDVHNLEPSAPDSVLGVTVAPDIQARCLRWALPRINDERNTLMLSYHYALGAWETDGWTTLEAASLASIEDTSSAPRVILGNYDGQLFQYGGVLNDGVPGGTRSGAVVSATGTSIVCSTVDNVGLLVPAAFHVAGAGLRARFVTIRAPNGYSERRRIVSNTADVLTVAGSWTTSPDAGWSFAIGAIEFEFDTPWRHLGSPWLKKRFEFGYWLFGASGGIAPASVEFFRDYDIETPVAAYTVPLKGGGLVWDQGAWDEQQWASGDAVTSVRRRLAKTGRAYRFRVCQLAPDQDITVLRVGVKAESLSDRR